MTNHKDIHSLNSSAVTSLLSVKNFVVGVLALGLAAWLIFPKDIIGKSSEGGASLVYAAYLSAAQKGNGSDVGIRLAAAREQLKLGNIVAAKILIEPLLADFNPDALRMMRKIKFDASNVLPQSISVRLRQELKAELTELTASDVQKEDVDLAKNIGAFKWLATNYQAQEQSVNAAEYFMLDGDFDSAMSIYQSHISSAVLKPAVTAAMASGNSVLAAQWLASYGELSSMTSVELYELAKASGSTDYLTPNNALLANNVEYRENRHQASVEILITQGYLDQAVSLLNLLLEEQPDNYAYRLQRWQLYRWTGQPKLAVSDGTFLILRGQNFEIIEATIADAIALVMYDEAVKLYGKLAVRQALTAAQYDEWFELRDLMGEWDEALADIDNELSKNRGNSSLLRWENYFYSISFDHKKLRQLWPRYTGNDSANFNELYPIARAFWFADDNEQAIAVLRRVSPSSIEENKEDYWRLFANVARRGYMKNAQLQGFDQMASINALPLYEVFWYANESYGDNWQKKLAWLWQEYDKREDEHILSFITWVHQVETDAETVKRFNALYPRITLTSARANVALLLARSAAGEQRNSEALYYYDEALRLTPNKLNILQEKAWFVLSWGDTDVLQELYVKLAPKWQNNDVALVLSALAQQLGYTQQATFLLMRLHQQQPENVDISYSLIELFAANSNDKYAQVLRQQLTRALLDDKAMPVYVKQSLVYEKYGALAAYNTLLNGSGAAAMRLDKPLHFSTLIGVNQFERALYQYNLWNHQRVDLPQWLHLQMALQTGDQFALSHILSAPSKQLPPADVAQAYSIMGKPHDGIRYAVNAISQPNTSEVAKLQLLRQIVALRSRSSNRISVNYETGTALRLSQQSIKFRYVSDKIQWTFGLGQQSFDLKSTDTLNLVGQSHHRIKWLAGMTYSNGDSEVDVSVDGDTASEQRVGLKGRYTHRLNNRANVYAGLALGQEVTDSIGWALAGQKQVILMGGRLSPTARTSIDASVEKLRYQDRSGASIAKGQTARLFSQYQWLTDRPNLSSYISVNETTFDDHEGVVKDYGGSLLSLVAQDYSNMAIGMELRKGNVRDEPLQFKGWQWLTNFAFNYDRRNKSYFVTSQVGVAAPVFGDDRLSIFGWFQPQSRQGDDNSKIMMNYTLRL